METNIDNFKRRILKYAKLRENLNDIWWLLYGPPKTREALEVHSKMRAKAQCTEGEAQAEHCGVGRQDEASHVPLL